MIRALTLARTAGALLAVLVATSCDDSDAPSSPVETPPPVSGADSSTSGDTTSGDTLGVADSLAQGSAILYTGIPYGPMGLWATVTSLKWGPAPFTLSADNSFAASVVARINAARQKRQRLVIAMTGGLASEYKTNGKFDLAKWKTRMNTFKTEAIKNAVAAAVADGTIVGNKLIDEPEVTSRWGVVITKPQLDYMATYVKNIFPTLPVGVFMGAPGYTWRTWERFKVVDYVLMQYQWSNNQGNIGSWRDKVLAWSRTEGVTPFFSLNILDGGVVDNVGTWDCAGTGGKGTLVHRCRMTADQVRTWGRAIGPYGCGMLMWRYDDAFMAKSANQSAFRDVASLLATKARRSCRRP
jgi:hypothetical protein